MAKAFFPHSKLLRLQKADLSDICLLTCKTKLVERSFSICITTFSKSYFQFYSFIGVSNKKIVFWSVTATRISLTYIIDQNISENLKFFTGNTTAQKMKFSMKDFSSKCDQIRSFLRI